MAKSKPLASSAVKQAVQTLRADALARADGEMIGSEEELLARHNVSRPTLRQAAALVAQEQLLTIKRGVGGGYIARRPTSRAVAHMAAVFLQTRGTGLEEIIQSVEPIRAELVRLAAMHVNEEDKAVLRQFLTREAERDEESAYRSFILGEREFGQLIGKISRNQVLSLFLEILYDLAATLRPEHDIYRGRPDRIAEYRAKRNWIAEAVVQGDVDLAVLAAHRCSNLGVTWMMEDLGRAYPSGRPVNEELMNPLGGVRGSR